MHRPNGSRECLLLKYREENHILRRPQFRGFRFCGISGIIIRMNKWIYILAGVIVLGVIAAYIASPGAAPAGPGPYDDLARCLKDKGVVFYGAFWCPHCQNQKKTFGASAGLLPYVECSTADANGQTPICQSKKINVYPTWIFPDGTRNEGEMTPQDLAAKSGCALPQGTATSSSTASSTPPASTTPAFLPTVTVSTTLATSSTK